MRARASAVKQACRSVSASVTSSTHLRPLVAAFLASHFLELRHHLNNGGTMREKKCILVSAPHCEKSDASSRPLRLRALVPSRSPPQFTAQLVSTMLCGMCAEMHAALNSKRSSLWMIELPDSEKGFVEQNELISTAVEMELLLGLHCDLLVVCSCLLQLNHVERSSTQLDTFVLSLPAFQLKIESRVRPRRVSPISSDIMPSRGLTPFIC